MVRKHVNKQRACVWLIGYAQCYKALNITFYAKFVFCIPEDFWVLMYHLLGIVYDKKHPWIGYHIGGIHMAWNLTSVIMSVPDIKHTNHDVIFAGACSDNYYWQIPDKRRQILTLKWLSYSTVYIASYPVLHDRASERKRAF